MLMQISMMPAVDAIIPLAEVTHQTIAAGSFFAATTWLGGNIPTTGSKVLVEHDVAYDGQSTDVIKWIRVTNAGSFTFADDRDTTLHVETFVSDRDAEVRCATLANELPAQFTCEIVLTLNAEIDHTVDYELLSGGMILFGPHGFYGAEMTTFDEVSVHPEIGDTSITFATAPLGWAVGNRIRIGGTRYYGYKSEGGGVNQIYDPQDENRVISSITNDGKTINFADPLVYDHTVLQLQAPGKSWDLHTTVINKDRNIKISSGNTSERWLRGHFMVMHQPASRLYYTQFEELGRTEKKYGSSRTTPNDDIYWPNRGLLPFEFSLGTYNTPALSGQSNVKGRYALHWHKLGVESLEFDAQAFAWGCAVNGSPGWGYAQHDSNVLMYLNTACEVSGAGFVTETANERGLWKKNCAMGVWNGVGVETAKQYENWPINFDHGRNGSGMRLNSRQVRMIENRVHSATGGFEWFHRSIVEGERPGISDARYDGEVTLDSRNTDIPDLFGYITGGIGANWHPVLHASRNVAIACENGLNVEKANAVQQSELRSVFKDHLFYNCINHSLAFDYTSHYSAIGGIIMGFDDDVPFQTVTRYGFATQNNSFDLSYVDWHVENVNDVFYVDNAFQPPEFDGTPLHNATQSHRAHTQSGVTHFNFKGSVHAIGPGSNTGFSYPFADEQTPLLDQFSVEFIDAHQSPVLTHAQGFKYYDYLGNGPSGNGSLNYRWRKNDSMGTVDSSLKENNHFSRDMMFGFMGKLGYYREVATGDNWLFLPVYNGDRGREGHFKTVMPVRLNLNIDTGFYSGRGVEVGTVDFAAAPDLDNLTMSGLPFPPENGRVSVQPDGTFRYFPDPGFDGIERIQHWMTDGKMVMQEVITPVDASAIEFRDFITIDPGVEVAAFPAAITFDITVAA